MEPPRIPGRFTGVATASYDAQDAMTAYGDTTYAYSPAGRLISATTGGQTTTYTYDPSDNLTAVTLPDATAVTYKVDPTGRRIARFVDGALTGGLVYAEGLAPIAATDASGAVTSTFTYGARGNVPDVMVKGGVTYRIVSDHLGSVRLVIDATTGAIAQRMDYDTFGNVLTDTNPGFQPFGFAGGLHDPATGLTRFGARDYGAKTGRWTTKDPIGFAGGEANLYAYVGGDPVNLIDPSGLYWGEGLVEEVVDVTEEIIRNPVAVVEDGAKGAANFVVGFTNAALGTAFEGFCGAGQSWSRNIGSATFWIETALWPAGKGASAFRRGAEYGVGSRGARVAPFGNRGPGRYHLPHYHRGRPDLASPGNSLRDQGLRRHRPWEVRGSDESFWNRF